MRRTFLNIILIVAFELALTSQVTASTILVNGTDGYVDLIVDVIGEEHDGYFPCDWFHFDFDSLEKTPVGILESKNSFDLNPYTYEPQFLFPGLQEDYGEAPPINPNTGLVTFETFYTEQFKIYWYPSPVTFTQNIYGSDLTNGRLDFQSFGVDWLGIILDHIKMAEPFLGAVILLILFLWQVLESLVSKGRGDVLKRR
jgi:hypothetical protein